MSKKFKTQWDDKVLKTFYEERTDMPSNTVPNQAMTVKEIYERYNSGRSLSGIKSPDYDDHGDRKYELDFDDYMPDVNKMDLADRQSIMEEAREHLETVKKKLNALALAKNQQRQKTNEKLEKRIKELEARQTEKQIPFEQSTQKGGTNEY